MEITVLLNNGQTIVVNRHEIEYNYKNNPYFQRQNDSEQDMSNWVTICNEVRETRKHEQADTQNFDRGMVTRHRNPRGLWY